MAPRVPSLPGALIEMRPVISAYLPHTPIPAVVWYVRTGTLPVTFDTTENASIFHAPFRFPICHISMYIGIEGRVKAVTIMRASFSAIRFA